MKNFLLVLSLLIVFTARADDVTVVARIHSLKEAQDTLHYPVILENEGLSSVLKKLDPQDDVLLKGRIEYHPVTVEGKTRMNPTFHVEHIVPVSLAKIGKVELVPVEQKITFATKPPFEPKTLGVSGKVATAITLTASILMLKELTGNQTTQPVQNDLNTGLIFSAGALATGAYLWEQFKTPKNSQK